MVRKLSVSRIPTDFLREDQDIKLNVAQGKRNAHKV